MLPGGSTISPHVTGATAEWIVERPRHFSIAMPNDDRPNNFPNYGEIGFNHCLAVEADEVDIKALTAGPVTRTEAARFSPDPNVRKIRQPFAHRVHLDAAGDRRPKTARKVW